jgi:hypothetical protein
MAWMAIAGRMLVVVQVNVVVMRAFRCVRIVVLRFHPTQLARRDTAEIKENDRKHADEQTHGEHTKGAIMWKQAGLI